MAETPIPVQLADHRPLTTADLPAIAEYIKAGSKPAAKKASSAKKGSKS